MAISLLEQLMSKTKVESDDITSAQETLNTPPVVNLEGVNAPEFKDSVPFDMETAYESQEQSAPSASLSIPVHNDGLDDDEPEVTPEHVGFVENVTAESGDTEAETMDNATERVIEEDAMDSATERVFGEDVELNEDGEPALWNLKPFNSQYFNFGGRTVNSLTRAGFQCFDDIRGMAYSELKALKGFGQGCLDEVLDLLEAENQSDWLLKRKKKVKSGGSLLSALQSASNSTPEVVESAAEEESVELAPATEEESAESAPAAEEESVESAPATEEESGYPEAYVVLKREFNAFEPVFISRDQDACRAYAAKYCQDVPSRIEAVRTDEVETPAFTGNETVSDDEAPASVETAPQTVSPKILVIGGSASLSRPGLNVASFEMVYTDVISTICQQSSVPSISSIDFGKGWGALSTTIRMNGWPKQVDVLTVSKSFMGRPEVLMELRLLADLILEA